MSTYIGTGCTRQRWRGCRMYLNLSAASLSRAERKPIYSSAASSCREHSGFGSSSGLAAFSSKRALALSLPGGYPSWGCSARSCLSRRQLQAYVQTRSVAVRPLADPVIERARRPFFYALFAPHYLSQQRRLYLCPAFRLKRPSRGLRLFSCQTMR